MTLPRPKRGITPRDFYHHYVPELWASLAASVPALIGVTVGVSVAGDGDYTIAVTADGIVTTDGKPTAPLVTFATDLASWRIALLELLPRLLKHIEPKLTPARLASYLTRVDLAGLRKTPGNITHVYEDDAGDEAKVVLTVGDGRGPTATVRATDAELWRIIESGAKLSQLVRSRITVDGDVTYLLALARVVEV